MRQTTEWTPLEGLRAYCFVLLRKGGFIAAGWVLVYFLSQLLGMRQDGSTMMLFAPLLGSLAGLVAGWHLAEDAVEDSGISGMPLWFMMILTGTLAIVLTEALLWFILRAVGHPLPVNFGGWMLLSSAILLMLASAVWRSSADG